MDSEHRGKLVLQGSVRKGQERVNKWTVAAVECSQMHAGRGFLPAFFYWASQTKAVGRCQQDAYGSQRVTSKKNAIYPPIAASLFP